MVWKISIMNLEETYDLYFKDKINLIKYVLLEISEGLEPDEFKVEEIENIYSDDKYKDINIDYKLLRKKTEKYWENYDYEKGKGLIEAIKKLNVTKEELNKLGIFDEVIIEELE